MNVPDNLFWDSNVFIRYLIGDRNASYFEDIELFIDDAKRNKRSIYFSTITFAEIKQDHFKDIGFGTIHDLFHDLGANFIPIDPSPNILISAGELRSAKTENPYPKEQKSRELSTPDAIILETCLFVRDVLGVSDIVFHTFDEGKGATWAGRAVPLLGFENWYPAEKRTDRVKKVCSLKREKPIHPQPFLGGI
jgi:predicted nucleic acid-binding protein